jgi:hypothetical protein
MQGESFGCDASNPFTGKKNIWGKTTLSTLTAHEFNTETKIRATTKISSILHMTTELMEQYVTELHMNRKIKPISSILKLKSEQQLHTHATICY